MRDRNIVEFPSGRSMVRHATSRASVAALVKRLALPTRSRPPETERRPLLVELGDLTGMWDGTLEQLTILAESRILTPASAARLAMRHACEIGHSRAGSEICRSARSYSHHLVLVGDLFSRSAFRIVERASGAWVACATFASFDLLSEICPMDGAPFCILPSANGRTKPSIELRRPRDWRADLANLIAAADRPGERHLLVVGGLPNSGRSRAVIVAGIEEGLRRNGLCVRYGRSCASNVVGTADERERQSRRHLVLIEIAFPGLVRGSGAGR